MEKVFSLSDFSDGQENILSLANPDLFDCRVHTYAQGHSILVIQILDRSQMEKFAPQYAIFEAVQYFEGYMWWKGANLSAKQHEIFIPAGTDALIKHPVRIFTFLSG